MTVLGLWLYDLAAGIAERLPELHQWRPAVTWYSDADDHAGGWATNSHQPCITLNVAALGLDPGSAPVGVQAEALRRVLVHELAHVVQFLSHGGTDTAYHAESFGRAAAMLAAAVNYPAPRSLSELPSWPLRCDDFVPPRAPSRPPSSSTGTTVAAGPRRATGAATMVSDADLAEAFAAAEARRWEVQRLSFARRADPVLNPEPRSVSRQVRIEQLLSMSAWGTGFREIDQLLANDERPRMAACAP